MPNVHEFLPVKTFTKKHVLGKFLIYFLLIPALFLFIAFRKGVSDTNQKYFIMVTVTFIIMMTFAVLNLLFSRFPIKVEISELSNSVRVAYLNGFGKQKQDIISLKNTQVRYVFRNMRHPWSGKQLRIIQNLFTNWIHIDKSHGYTAEQIEEMYKITVEINNKP